MAPLFFSKQCFWFFGTENWELLKNSNVNLRYFSPLQKITNYFLLTNFFKYFFLKKKPIHGAFVASYNGTTMDIRQA